MKKGLFILENLFPLIGNNSRVEIYDNQFIHSENLIFKGSMEVFKKTKKEELKKYFSSPVFQLIGAGHSLIIILRKGVYAWGDTK